MQNIEPDWKMERQTEREREREMEKHGMKGDETNIVCGHILFFLSVHVITVIFETAVIFK